MNSPRLSFLNQVLRHSVIGVVLPDSSIASTAFSSESDINRPREILSGDVITSSQSLMVFICTESFLLIALFIPPLKIGLRSCSVFSITMSFLSRIDSSSSLVSPLDFNSEITFTASDKCVYSPLFLPASGLDRLNSSNMLRIIS